MKGLIGRVKKNNMIILRKTIQSRVFQIKKPMISHMIQHSLQRTELHQKRNKSELNIKMLLMLAKEVVVCPLLQRFLMFVWKFQIYLRLM